MAICEGTRWLYGRRGVTSDTNDHLSTSPVTPVHKEPSVMTEHESDHDRLIRIEEAVETIKQAFVDHPPIRHVNKEGMCDAYQTVVGHDRRINQYIGFTAAISLVFSMIGGAIVAFITWIRG